MTVYSKKNLRDYNINDSSRDKNLKYAVPLYSANALHLSSSNSSKGILTTSNFSNNEIKDSGKKKSHLLKWQSTQMKYKGKKSTDSSSKSAGKYTLNYSSKRPKSAKGVGASMASAKYQPTENTSSLYKYSMQKVSNSSKYNSSSKKKQGNTSQLRKTQPIKNITTKTKKDYLVTSYRKSNVSSTHKKYTKTSRGKDNTSNSRLQEQGSTVGSNSSRFSPPGYSRNGLGTHDVNTKSYNSLMTMLMNKETDIYKTTVGTNLSGGAQSNTNTPNSYGVPVESTRLRTVEVEHTFKRKVDPKSFKKSEITLYTSKPGQKKLKNDLEEYLKTSRIGGSRNHFGHSSNVHTQKTHR